MKIIYIKETEKTYSIIEKMLLNLKKFLNIVKVKDNNMYYLPVFKGSKLSEYRIKRLTNKINSLLEIDGTSTVALSEYLNSNQLIKNYLYSKNIDILNGRFLFKCFICEIIEYIFKIKNKAMEFRRSFIAN